MMNKLEIDYTLSYQRGNIISTAHGTISLVDFDEQVQEIKRWMDGRNATCSIDQVRYVDSGGDAE